MLNNATRRFVDPRDVNGDDWGVYWILGKKW